MRRLPKGFTLIEVLVVVSLIALLATVAMLNLGRSRITAHEQFALKTIRYVGDAVQSYMLINFRFPSDLTELVEPASSPAFLRTDHVGDGTSFTKRGYVYRYESPNAQAFTLHADPEVPGSTGERYFFYDLDGSIHYNSTGVAGPGDPAL